MAGAAGQPRIPPLLKGAFTPDLELHADPFAGEESSSRVIELPEKRRSFSCGNPRQV
jgi:hypothetical protein